MQIPNVRNSVASTVDYFLQSSWKGKTVQGLCMAAFFALIYYVAFRKKRSDSPSTPLAGRVQTNPRAQSKEFPKADLTYIKTATVQPDFVTKYQTEFGTWLSEKMECYNRSWVAMSKGTTVQQASCSMVLRKFVPELIAQVKKMVPVFKAHPDIKTDDWDLFLNECNAVADRRASLEGCCIKLKECLDNLQGWNSALQKEHQAKFMQQVGDAKIYPHYEFTDLQTQYFYYLGLQSENDFSKLLSTKRGYLATVGLSEMEDVDCLELRTMQPSIERLGQLFCFVNITGDEERLRPLIMQEIKSCREILSRSDKLSDILNNSQELKDNVKSLRGLFGELEKNSSAEGLALLKKIEQKDIARQLIHLKGYIHQQDHLAKWTQLNKQGCFQLAAYAQHLDLNFPLYHGPFLGTNGAPLSTFYKMGD